MDPAIVPVQKSATSYADALRGHKLFAPKTRPLGDSKVEVAPVPKEVPKTNPKTTQKTAQKKTSAARKKDAKASPKVAPGSEAGSQPRLTAHSEKTLQPASSNPWAWEAAKAPAESRFSYAEAVKGKSAWATLRPEIVEIEETKTNTSFSTGPSTPKLQPAGPPLAEFAQPKPGARCVTEPESHGVVREVRSPEDDSDARHAAAWPALPRILDTGPSYHRPKPHVSPRDSPLLLYTSPATNTGGSKSPGPPPLAIKQIRRFSAGDLSIPPVPHILSARTRSTTSTTHSITSTARSTRSTTHSTTSTAPSQTAPSQHSTLSSTTSSALPTNSLVDTAIQQVIMLQALRNKMVVDREEQRAKLISCHDRKLLS